MVSILRFLKSEDGPAAVEYAVMTALILLACVSSVQIVGCRTNLALIRVNNAID